MKSLVPCITLVLLVLAPHTSCEADDGFSAYSKARLFQTNGFFRRAAKYYARAVELDANNVRYLNGFAWLLATTEDKQLQDGKNAVELAREAYLLAEDDEKPIYADTLAAAYARKGVPALAIQWQARALPFFREHEEWKSEVKVAEERFQYYKALEPWEDTSGFPPMEPVLLPRSLVKKDPLAVGRLLANEEMSVIPLMSTIYVWHHTGIRPPKALIAGGEEVVAPLEHEIVSDEVYQRLVAGGHRIISIAVRNHRDVVEKINACDNITREEHHALLAELAVGASEARIAEIEHQCRQDVSEGYELLHKVWRNIEVANGKKVAEQLSAVRQ